MRREVVVHASSEGTRPARPLADARGHDPLIAVRKGHAAPGRERTGRGGPSVRQKERLRQRWRPWASAARWRTRGRERERRRLAAILDLRQATEDAGRVRVAVRTVGRGRVGAPWSGRRTDEVSKKAGAAGVRARGPAVVGDHSRERWAATRVVGGAAIPRGARIGRTRCSPLRCASAHKSNEEKSKPAHAAQRTALAAPCYRANVRSGTWAAEMTQCGKPHASYADVTLAGEHSSEHPLKATPPPPAPPPVDDSLHKQVAAGQEHSTL
jgi:hypothetical protein